MTLPMRSISSPVVAVAAFLGAAVSEAALPPEIAKRVEAAVLDQVRGRAGDAHEKLQPMLEIGNPAQQKEIDALLQRYHVVTPLGPFVAELRIDATLASSARLSKTLKPMGPTEAGFVQAVVETKLDSLLGPIDEELAIGFRVDAAVEALEEQLVRCSSLLDQMDAVERLQALQTDAAKLARVKGPKKDQKKEVAANKTRREQLVSRIVEIALTVIPDQLDVLRDDSAEYANRAKASARLEDSFAVAKAYFPKYRGAKKSVGKSVGGKTVGQQEGLLKEREHEFDKLAGPLRLKIYHFEQGKQWWLRGRWGVGPYHDGETKAVSGRPTLDAFLFYPLLLPDPYPKPNNPLKDARPLPVGRRHLDVWKATLPAGQAYARAERNFRISNQIWKLSLPPPGQGALSYNKIVDSDDDFNPFVGYLEYQMALYHWGRLLTLAGEAELKGLEKSLAADDRFIVPSYLSRQYDGVDPNSTLKLTPSKTDDPRATDVYERRGLSWCIALAQVEVGGVRAVYTGLEFEPRPAPPSTVDRFDPNNQNAFVGTPAVPVRRPRSIRPFDRVSPTPFTQRALAELLWDAMRQQYYRVRAEVFLGNFQTSLPNEFLAPVTRIAVALEFVRAYRLRFGGTLTAAQLNELRLWQNDLERRLGQLSSAWAINIRDLTDQIERSWQDGPNRPIAPTPTLNPGPTKAGSGGKTDGSSNGTGSNKKQ